MYKKTIINLNKYINESINKLNAATTIMKAIGRSGFLLFKKSVLIIHFSEINKETLE